MHAIQIKNLTKIYKLYDSPAARLKEAFHPLRKKFHHDFYALKNLSLNIAQGETLGIIGKNGSGKTTLLKIISGLLSPSSGSLEKSGRVSAILDLGAGFHPEYSGMENIYFNAALMGFQKKEIDGRLDDIIEFADIGEFIEQPVKTYSSGMFLRLAFAIAINVEPDILAIDETLAVGDIRFQQKSYRKIKEFQENGKTIVFVSHDLSAVQNFCHRAIWLDEGKIIFEGAPEEAIKRYVSHTFHDLDTIAGKEELHSKSSTQAADDDIEWDDVSSCAHFGEGGAEIKGVALYSQDKNRKITTLKGGERLRFYILAEIARELVMPGFGIICKDRLGYPIFEINNYIYGKSFDKLAAGEKIVLSIDFTFPRLGNGTYTISAAIAEGTHNVHTHQHWIHDACIIQVLNEDIKYTTGQMFVVEESVEINCKRIIN